MDVSLVTCDAFPHLSEDDRALITALAAEGVTAEPGVWSQAAYPWADRRAAVLRSTWDYHRRAAYFLEWCDQVASVTLLLNTPATVRWNFHKFYLQELAARGVPIVPTEFVHRGSGVSFASICQTHGWTEAVVKPAVSAAADRTYRVSRNLGAVGETRLQEILADGDALVQPYLPSFGSEGERSFVFIDGRFSHAVRRPPEMEPGSVSLPPSAVSPSASEAAIALQAINALGVPHLYARVDLVKGLDGRPCLGELELIEPALFLSTAPGAAGRLARAITHRLGRKR